ncbi:MAG TPA: dihydropteroate synthase [Fredinandcohnia sp.]|nr:dihydropteroate synthase [Fredinandcohnia sp.]
MEIRVRFVSVDGLEALHHGLTALGFPAPAREMLASGSMQGHLLVTGLSAEALAVCRELAARAEMPRLVEGATPGALLISGRLGAFKLLGEALQRRADVEGAAVCGGKILRACFYAGERPVVRVRDLVLGAGPAQVMGILNVTPDSFSDGGTLLSEEALLRRAELLVEAGATLLDVGGESTRPRGIYGEGARPVDAAEERARVEPAVRALRRRFPDVVISVDTSKAEVARAALGEGADLVNDVRGLKDDELARVVAESGAPCCLMHMPAEPDEMARHTDYEDVVGEVAEALVARVDAAIARGVRPDGILVDPGFGFGKTFGQNLVLLRELENLRASVGRPILVGTSRKGFLGHVTGRPVGERDAATAASVAVAIAHGAAVVRVHDAAACRDAVLVASAVAQATEAGRLFTEAE